METAASILLAKIETSESAHFVVLKGEVDPPGQSAILLKVPLHLNSQFKHFAFVLVHHIARRPRQNCMEHVRGGKLTIQEQQ